MDNKYLMIGLGVGLLALLYIVKKPGAAASAGVAVGTAAVDAVGGAVSGVTTGVVTGVSEAVGLPTPAETITDAQQCKLYLDANGYLAASAKCSAPAFFEAITL